MARPSAEPDSALVEAIARRVAELLDPGTGKAPATLVDASAVARELGVERDWVYSHATALGAIRLGGPRGRLRFDLSTVRERLGGVDAAIWRPARRPPRRASTPKVARMPLAGRVKSTPTAKSGRAARERPRPDTGRSPDAVQR